MSVALVAAIGMAPAVGLAHSGPTVEVATEAVPANRLTIAEGVRNGSIAVENVRAGWVRIRSLYSNQDQCLDADANAGGNGTKVQVWT